MMPNDFAYDRPATAAEAVRLFGSFDAKGKSPMYYSGGTEVITFGRLGLVRTGAVIDIKGIPECRALGYVQDDLVLGAGLSLTEVEEANPFPLLSKTSGGVADRTARNKITLGGNVCGRIFYREAVLPFLLADSDVVLAGASGWRRLPIRQVFRGEMQLGQGELLLGFLTSRSYLSLPHVHLKRRQQWKTGYPLVTAAALRKDDRLRVAFSGVCPFPFRSAEMEEALNARGVAPAARIDEAVRRVPALVLNDVEGSAEYRLFVLRNALADIVDAIGGE